MFRAVIKLTQDQIKKFIQINSFLKTYLYKININSFIKLIYIKSHQIIHEIWFMKESPLTDGPSYFDPSKVSFAILSGSWCLTRLIWWSEVRERAPKNFQKNCWNQPVSWQFPATTVADGGWGGAGLIEGSEVVRLGPVLPETVAWVGRNRCLKLAGRDGSREKKAGFIKLNFEIFTVLPLRLFWP